MALASWNDSPIETTTAHLILWRFNEDQTPHSSDFFLYPDEPIVGGRFNERTSEDFQGGLEVKAITRSWFQAYHKRIHNFSDRRFDDGE